MKTTIQVYMYDEQTPELLASVPVSEVRMVGRTLGGELHVTVDGARWYKVHGIEDEREAYAVLGWRKPATNSAAPSVAERLAAHPNWRHPSVPDLRDPHVIGEMLQALVDHRGGMVDRAFGHFGEATAGTSLGEFVGEALLDAWGDLGGHIAMPVRWTSL